MIRVADYIADFIYKQGTKDVFLLSGGGSIYLDDGIACNKNLNPICARSEATATMMAEAYARLTQKLGVVYVTTGPGGANAVSGVTEAWVDSAPILVISGQVERNCTTYNARIKKLRTFGTQELNIIAVVKSITKYAQMVNDPERIRYHLEKACCYAKSGRPGPVWLDIPLDVQAAMVDETKLKGYKLRQIKTDKKYLDDQIENIVKLLKDSRKPLIIAGQGIRMAKAITKFKELVEYLNVPVIFSRLGQDILPFSHKNNFGHGGTKGSKFTGLIMKQSDLILSLGSRLAVPFAGINLDAFSKKAKVIMVDIDEAELRKFKARIDLPLIRDVKEVITKILDKVSVMTLPNYSSWLEMCRGYKREYPLVTPENKRNPIDLYYFVSRLDELSGENDIFVSDAGSANFVTGQALKFEKGQREITSGAFASMGLAIPLAIGCSVAKKDAQILAVTGDGSLELNIQELKTMSCYNLNIKLFVINNGGYLSIRNTQDTLCQGRYVGSDQRSEMLDFQKVADAFDLPYCNIKRYEEIDDKISEIIGRKGPALIEVICDNNQKIIEPLGVAS